MEKAVKLCIDCKHQRWDLFGKAYYRCVSPLNGVDLVTGKLDKGFCDVNRRFQHSCGPDARWFEPKKEKK